MPIIRTVYKCIHSDSSSVPLYPGSSSIHVTLAVHQSPLPWQFISPLYLNSSSVLFTFTGSSILLPWQFTSPFYADGSSVLLPWQSPVTSTVHQSPLHWQFIGPFCPDSSSVPFNPDSFISRLYIDRFINPFYPDNSSVPFILMDHQSLLRW